MQSGINQTVVGNYKNTIYLLETVTAVGTRVWNLMDDRRKDSNKFVNTFKDKEEAEKAYVKACNLLEAGPHKFSVTYLDANRKEHTILIEADSNAQARIVTTEEVGRFIKIKKVQQLKEVK